MNFYDYQSVLDMKPLDLVISALCAVCFFLCRIRLSSLRLHSPLICPFRKAFPFSSARRVRASILSGEEKILRRNRIQVWPRAEASREAKGSSFPGPPDHLIRLVRPSWDMADSEMCIDVVHVPVSHCSRFPIEG